MRSGHLPLARRLLCVSASVFLVATTLGVAVNAASATTVANERPNPLSDKLQRLLHPEAAQPNALADAPLTEITSGPGSLTSNAPGQLVVEIRVRAITAPQVAAVKGAGADVFFTDNPTRTLTANVAITDLEKVAAVPGVEYVNEVLRPATSSTCEQGIRVSEGDVQVNAANARVNKNVSGAGVKVGVLSDSFNTKTSSVPATNQATDITNGDLPGPANTCTNQQTVSNVVDFPNGTDEGRGMAQIVHDLAPQSPIDFSTANNTQAIFANNIRNLQTAGAKVIVDDITYFAEPMYQDGVIAQAIQDVTDAGTVYYSSAGNNNFNVGGVPVSSYEAQNGYRPMACPATIPAGHVDCHDFDPGAGTSDGDTVTWSANTTLRFVMGWNEPAFGVVTDYDMYFLDGAGNVVLSSTNNNLTSQTPFEFWNAATGGSAFTGKLVVARKSTTPATNPRFKIVFFGNGAQGFSAVQFSSLNSTDTFGPATYGHNAKINAGTIAAVPFNNSNVAEAFTSKGPATYCYGPIIGTTPATPLAGGCQTKQIDMAATDGGANTFFGQNAGGGTFRFYGTSAAAPHAAAVAALIRQARPCATPAQIIAAQKSTAAAVGTEAVNTVGAGLINADLAIGALAPCPPILPPIAPINVSEGNVVTIDFPGAVAQPATDTLAFDLTQTSGPAVNFVQSSGATQRKFIAPLTTTLPTTTLGFNLTATDTTNGTSTTVPVVVNDTNIVPTAVPSAPKIVTAGTTVVLQGASNDQIQPDTAPSGTSGRQYAWSQTGGPGTVLTPGVGAGFRIASFTPATPGTYTFQLVVTDHGGTGAASAPVSVSVQVRAPASAGTLSGVVKDQGGAPLSTATVQVYANTPSGAPVATTSTDASGAWSVGGLTAGVGYFVNFSKGGFSTRWQYDGFDTSYLRAVNTPNAIVDATLSSVTRTITGFATDSTGSPLTGVKATLVDESGPLTAVTTAAGVYSFSGLTPKSTYRVQLAGSNAPYVPAWVTTDGRGANSGASGQAILLIDTTAGNATATTTAVYQTSQLRSLTATVTTGRIGIPVTGAELRVYNPGWVASQRTNVAGVYTITGLRPQSTYQVWVWTQCAGCTSGALTSQWAVGVPGNQYDQTGKLAGVVDLTTNQALSFNL